MSTLTDRYVRNQAVARIFYPHWNEERVKDLARLLWPLDENLWPLNKITDLLRRTEGSIQVSAEDEEDLLEIEIAACFLEGVAGEKSLLSNPSYPVWMDPYKRRPHYES